MMLARGGVPGEVEWQVEHRRQEDAHAGSYPPSPETIIIGSETAGTVVAVNGSQVRLGIDAPKHIRSEDLACPNN